MYSVRSLCDYDPEEINRLLTKMFVSLENDAWQKVILTQQKTLSSQQEEEEPTYLCIFDKYD